MNKLEYDAKYGSVKYDWESYFAPNKLSTLQFKNAAVKLRTESGKYDIGQGKMNFIASKYKEEQPMKVYNFSKFISGATSSTDDEPTKHKFDPKNVDFKDYEKDEFNPVQIDNTDVNFEFDNENAIVVDFNKKKK